MLLTALPVFSVLAADPIIVQGQPSSFNVTVGTSVQLEFLFFGGEAPAIQWQSAPSADGPWANVSGANAASYTPSTSSAGATFYRCVVTDVSETVISDTAIVNVYTGSTTAGAVVGYPASGSTVGKNQAIFLLSNTPAANGLKIFYEVGATAADTATPTINSTLYDGSYAVVIPATGTSYCIKAFATSTAGPASAVATLTYTITPTNTAATARLTDIKDDPDFLAWKAGNWEGPVPASVDAKITQVIARMTNSEKATFLGGEGNGSQRLGSSGGSIRAMLSLGIPQTGMPDGPAGLRINANASYSATASSPAIRRTTYWPQGTSRAATWNRPLNEKMGEAFGEEMYYYGTDLILMPGMNLHRSVLNGRNFEYYSEDPLLSGMTAAYETRGIQSQGVGVTLKHYIANQQETGRTNHVTTIGSRALRELYLRNFEYAIVDAHPWAIMNSYNQVNGESTASSRWLNTIITRDEFGFDGFIMTDWGSGNAVGGNAGGFIPPAGTSQATSSNNGTRVWSGNDLAQMGQTATQITDAVTSTSHPLTQAMVDTAVRRLLQFVVKTPVFNNKPASQGATPNKFLTDHREIGVGVGEESVILLKNEEVNGKPALPLAKPSAPQQVLLLGTSANTIINGGTGSGAVNMTGESIPTYYTAISNLLGGSARVILGSGASGVTTTNSENVYPETLWTSTWNTPNITSVIYFIRRTSGEGSDIGGATSPTSGMSGYLLNTQEQNIINRASTYARSRGIPFIVVFNTGSWVTIEGWKNQADAIVQGWQQGMGGGVPGARVLFGDVNPSGKLPTTVPTAVTGNNAAANGNTSPLNPAYNNWGAAATSNVYYYEGIYLGYRYFDTFNVPVTFPFGHGLSYTTFEYSDAKLSKTTFSGKGDTLTASVTITNTGNVAGKEIVQFYVGAPGIQMPKPVKELKGYDKTDLLQPGESQTITVEFTDESLMSYSDGRTSGAPANGTWCVEKGHYVVYFAASSKDIRSTRSFVVPNDFAVKTVTAAAMQPSTTLSNTLFGSNALNPTQITVTFVPPEGATASFQKKYSVMGSRYGYLPVPADPNFGYEWYGDQAMTTRVNVTSVVPSSATTLYGKLVRTPAKITVYHDVAHASVGYTNDSAGPVKGQLFIAFYDADGKLIAVESEVPAEATAAGETFTLSVSLPLVPGTVSVKAFLWDAETFVPMAPAASLAL